MVYSSIFLILFTIFRHDTALSIPFPCFLCVIKTCSWQRGLMMWHSGLSVMQLSLPKYLRMTPTEATFPMMLRTLMFLPGIALMISWQLLWKYFMFSLGTLFSMKLLWCYRWNSFPACSPKVASQKILGHYYSQEQVQSMRFFSYFDSSFSVLSLSLPSQQFRIYSDSTIFDQQYTLLMTTANLSAFLAYCLLIQYSLTLQYIFCSYMQTARVNFLKLNFLLQYSQKMQFLIQRSMFLSEAYIFIWLNSRQKMRCMILFLILRERFSQKVYMRSSMLLGFYSVIMVSRRCISFRIDFLYSEEMHSMQFSRLYCKWQIMSQAGCGFLLWFLVLICESSITFDLLLCFILASLYLSMLRVVFVEILVESSWNNRSLLSKRSRLSSLLLTMAVIWLNLSVFIFIGRIQSSMEVQ